MTHIILAVIAIGLVISVFTSGMWYVSPDAGERSEIRAQITGAIGVLGSGYSAYRIANAQRPATPGSFSDLAIFPGYAKQPRPISGLAWSYGIDGSNGGYFCLSGTATKVVAEAISRVGDAYPSGSIEFTDSCGGSAIAMGTIDFPTTIQVTYWPEA